ncbi:MAG: 50S ribosomal protein L32 [Candidatus Tagabacteria bacterium CG09_land_8_20_14_0_10_41_14]|uniref:Large ribosomal subunit protein bL32 n=2 Tax=Candidatus Tagaibacteriota TaxID=1817918 RepID=A0A2H0WKM6_9BACT|nr:MAG: 50S ribosomal protein L32 [Candidatus Tagabacteria bacterium CG09_land_8_20_14_0_10_41_14]PJE73077.1 MAG: 50S ribosomal protein L32 [Candidatus Tagabacteria bacterium CG10_big_fil_rev_8_21_14_0_10_40_13]
MTIRMRHTKSHRNKRRSHHGLKETALSACEKCGELKLSHVVCENCGAYKKRSVLDVLKKLTKKQKKQKQKELKEQEGGSQKEMSMEELSQK